MVIQNEQPSSNRKQRLIDLHLHTTASDGTFSPTKMVQLAKEVGLSAIAITDHDTVAGIPEALAAGEKMDIEVIPGIELSTETQAESVHVVGLFVDYTNKELLKLTAEICDARENRAKKIIEKVNQLEGFPKITFAEVERKAHGLIGKPHIAEIMLEKGYGETIDEIFQNYLRRGGPCYVQRFKLTPSEGIKLLRKIGAIPILAHPGIISGKLDIERFIQKNKRHGLMGLEVQYPAHSDEQKLYFRELINKYDLLESGGSDCHGLLNDGPFIGSVKVPYELLQKMKNRLLQQ
jgi:hypothetical protein